MVGCGGYLEDRIARFIRPFEHEDPQKRSPLAFLIVKSMLLTGFDAPIEGVMYLDRSIREAELLQAIARVNRTGHGKTAGIVVDYFGIAKHLKEALTEYSAEDIEGALQSLADEIPKLRDRHERVIAVFRSRGIDPMTDQESAIEALRDEKLRAEFTVKLKHFLATVDLVLPRPEALPYVRVSAVLGGLYKRAGNPPSWGVRVAQQVGRPKGAKVDRRSYHFARHRPTDSTDLDHRCEVRRVREPKIVSTGQGFGDGARDSPPHQEEDRGGPRALYAAVPAPRGHPAQIR